MTFGKSITKSCIFIVQPTPFKRRCCLNCVIVQMILFMRQKVSFEIERVAAPQREGWHVATPKRYRVARMPPSTFGPPKFGWGWRAATWATQEVAALVRDLGPHHPHFRGGSPPSHLCGLLAGHPFPQGDGLVSFEQCKLSPFGKWCAAKTDFK